MRVDGALAAHFRLADGPSRPGVEWIIGLKQRERTWQATVKAFFADDATAATMADQEYQAHTAMQYLNALLGAGWNPDQPRDHTIFIGNPVAPGAAQGGPRDG